MLEGNKRFHGKNFTMWKQRMLVIFLIQRRDKKFLGKEFQNTTDEDNHAKHDPKNQEAVMSVKLSLTNDMFT